MLTNITARSLGSWIRQTARDLRAYLIIDCCFAAALQHGFLSSPLGLAELRLNEALPDPSIFETGEELPTSGVALLAASGLDDPASAPPGERYTRFTTALLEALREGDERLPHTISLSDLHELVRRRILRAYPDGARPELKSLQQTRGRVELIRLFPNPAARLLQQRREPERRAQETQETHQAELRDGTGGPRRQAEQQVQKEEQQPRKDQPEGERKRNEASDNLLLAQVAHRLSDPQVAEEYYRKALQLFTELGDVSQSSFCQEGLAAIDALRRDPPPKMEGVKEQAFPQTQAGHLAQELAQSRRTKHTAPIAEEERKTQQLAGIYPRASELGPELSFAPTAEELRHKPELPTQEGAGAAPGQANTRDQGKLGTGTVFEQLTIALVISAVLLLLGILVFAAQSAAYVVPLALVAIVVGISRSRWYWS